jgi:hypothetical protein
MFIENLSIFDQIGVLVRYIRDWILGLHSSLTMYEMKGSV